VILAMAKVQVIGPRERLGGTLAFLQRRGVLQLRASDEAAEGGGALVRPVTPGPDAEALAKALLEAAERASALAARLPPAAPGARPEQLPEPGGSALLARLAVLEEEVASLTQRRAALLDEQESMYRFERLVVALSPIRHRLDPGLLPEIHGLFLKDDPEALALLAQEAGRITDGRYELQARALGDGDVGVLLTVPKSASREIGALLFAQGVEEVRLPPGFAGKALIDVLVLLAGRRAAIPREIAEVDAELARLGSAFGPALAEAETRARAALGRLRATAQCGQTRFAFVVAGWTPADQVSALRAAAEEELGGSVALLAHPPELREWGQVPVLLRNPRWLRPFQLLLGLVPLPRYGTVDPTPWLAVTFPLFFGFVLGDVAFGVLAAGVALLVIWRGWGGRMGKDVAAVGLACAASALLFGLLFGEALGDVGATLGLRPLLFHRRREVLAFLALAVAVGGAHILTGAALGAAMAVRARHVRAAVARFAKLGLLVAMGVGAVAVAGPIPRGWLVGAVAALGVLVVVAVAAEGPMAALDLVLGLGNVLSYSRLMALGLASAMLADVANSIARGLEPAIAGFAIGLLLHAVNFSLGLVSPVVAALRLHYVEFFERFYEEGGEPFRPFALTG
jgi:V/A-type H+-transporting ATPase subunit I